MADVLVDLTPKTLDIKIRSGDVRGFRIRTSEPALWTALTNNGTGGDWLAQVRKKEGSDEVAFELELIEEADALAVIIPEATQSVFDGNSNKLWLGVYDIQGKIEGVTPVTLVEGIFRIERDVSRV